MKILVLCYEFPPVGGGGGRVAAQVAEGLARRGHEVKVQTSGMSHLPVRENQNGVEILRTACFRQRENTCSVPEMALYLAASFVPVWRLVSMWKPNVIHAHFAVPTGALAFAISRLTGVPYVLTAHLGDVPGGVPEQTSGLFRLVNPFAKIVWKNAARTTAVSSFVAGLARDAYGLEPILIRNGIQAQPAAPVVVHEPPRIIFAGRLSVQKNPLLALQALSLVRDLKWFLDVIGEGPLGEAMRKEADRLELQDRVTFHGWLPGGHVSDIMAKADILLMTSLHEGLPMVAVEALQHGLAIIGSNIGGMRDVVEDGKNGFLCNPQPEFFAGRLRQLLSNKEQLRTIRDGSIALAPRFDLSQTVLAYEETIRAAASGKP